MKRIYVVEENGSDGVVRATLVEAGSQAQAIRHVAGSRFSASPASARQVADLLGEGAKVEVANAE